MSRVEPTRRSDDPRQSQQSQGEQQPREENIGHTPSKAEGDEATIDEALRNNEKRR